MLPGQTEDPPRGTSGLCLSRVMKDAPAVRGRWHRVPRDGTPREKQRVPDVVPQLGTHKLHLTARTHQTKPAKKWRDGVLRTHQCRRQDTFWISGDRDMTMNGSPDPGPHPPPEGRMPQRTLPCQRAELGYR